MKQYLINRLGAAIWFGAVAIIPVIIIQALGHMFYLAPAPYKFSILPVAIAAFFGAIHGVKILADPLITQRRAFWLGSRIALYSWFLFFAVSNIWHCAEGNCGPQYSVAEETFRTVNNGLWLSIVVLPILVPIGGLAGLLLDRIKPRRRA